MLFLEPTNVPHESELGGDNHFLNRFLLQLVGVDPKAFGQEWCRAPPELINVLLISAVQNSF